MTDLSEKLDQSKRQRLVAAIRALGEAEYRDMMISLMGGIGVRVQSAREDQGTLVILGQGEESYLVLASRLDFNDPELIARSLLEEAKTEARTPVFMTLQSLDAGTLNFLEKEKVSYADLDKFLALLEKYGLDDPLLVKEDLKILEDRGEPCLPSVCKLEALLEEAEERRKKGDLIRAVQVLDLALEIKPLNDSLWLKKANYLLEMGRAGAALASANRAAELRSGDAATWFLIALIQNQLGDREKELAAYDNVLRINPRHAPAMLNKGATLYELGRLEWSLKVFNDLVHRYPLEPRGWNNRGLVLKGLERNIEALASFEKSSVLDRNFADPLINIARMLEEKGDVKAAVEVWKDVLRLVDSRADIWDHLGSCLRDIGEYEDALTAMDRALYLEPSLELVRQQRDALANLMTEAAEEEPSPEAQVPVEAIMEEFIPQSAPEVETKPVEETTEAVVETTVAEEAPAAESTETSIALAGPVLPAILPEDKALMERESPGQLETVPEGPRPIAAPKDPLSIEAPEGPGAPPMVDEPTEGPEAEDQEPIEIMQETISPEAEYRPTVEMVQEVIPEPKVEPVQEIVAQVEIVQESVPTPEVPVELVQETVPAEEGKEVPVLKRKAEWPFEVSLRPLPNDREDRARLEANLLIAGKEREKALQVAEIGLKEGSDLELVLLKARALLSLGRGEEAAEALKNALRHAPDDVHIVMDMEALFHRYGGEGSRLLKGISACREARTRVALDLLERQEYAEIARMEVKDEGTTVKHAKALAQMRLGRYRDASKLLKMVLSEFPAYAEGLNNMGVCMRFMGEFDYDQAIHTMELALEVDSHYSDAMNNIGCTLFAAGRYDQALKVLHAVVDEDRRPEYLLNLSYVQMVLGDVAGAKDSLTTALKMDEGADVLYMLGVIAESEKQYRWALSLFTDALEKSPGFREAQAGKDRTRLLAKK